jgi:hypothetical protein
LTCATGMINMFAGAILLLRRITTCVVLLALAGIYAMPLAAALSPNAMDCCTGGMCPRPGRAMGHQQTREQMPDCDGMGAPARSMRKCDMGASNSPKVQAVNVGLFVLSAPTKLVRSSAKALITVAIPISEYFVSHVPVSPPPRISLS